MGVKLRNAGGVLKKCEEEMNSKERKDFSAILRPL